MEKIYSYKKEIIFKTNIYDIVSIALDKKFSIENNSIKGIFQVNGEYLINEKEREEFNYQLPYINYIDDNYDISNISIDIDDFYYEIKDSTILIINIDIKVDGIEEIRCIDETDEMIETKNDNVLDNKNIKEEVLEIKEDNNKYVSYNVCIVRENDTIESIIERYNTSLDNIKKYNVINEIKVGDKIIIPYERS